MIEKTPEGWGSHLGRKGQAGPAGPYAPGTGSVYKWSEASALRIDPQARKWQNLSSARMHLLWK